MPSDRYLDTAGVRIRYNRISAPLAKLGWTLHVVPINDVPDLSNEDSDIYLFSKCQDARALMLATAARRAGIVVGVDLFDDYFSQQHDSRFAAQRLWLQSMATEASFFLCSTPRMLQVASKYFPKESGHVLADPHEEFDAARLEQELAAKIRKATRERRIPILWFGMGANPNFSVGLHDLAAFGEALRPFSRHGYNASLTIITNTKEIDGRVLERLRRIPIPFVLREWSKAREEEALSRCLVTFLPVNFQEFSIAKSLNRGVSALVGGTQLLSGGYPLYEGLGDYVYNDAADLIVDLESSRLKLSSGRVGAFSEWIDQQAAPAAEALSLVEFLDAKVHSSHAEPAPERPWGVLHGTKSAASISAFARRVGWLSLGSPLSPDGTKFDAHLGFFNDDSNLRLRVSPAALDHLPEHLRVAAVLADNALGNSPIWEVPLDALAAQFSLQSISRLTGRGSCAEGPIAAEVTKLTRTLFTRLFQDIGIVDSELDSVANILRTLERI